jgi:hypothetical protein
MDITDQNGYLFWQWSRGVPEGMRRRYIVAVPEEPRSNPARRKEKSRSLHVGPIEFRFCNGMVMV